MKPDKVTEQVEYRHWFDGNEETIPSGEFSKIPMRPTDMLVRFQRTGVVDKSGAHTFGPWVKLGGYIRGYYVKKNGDAGAETGRTIYWTSTNLGGTVGALITETLLALNGEKG